MYIAESAETPCQEWPASLWFAKLNTMMATKAKTLCFDCPERLKCLDSTLDFERAQGHVSHGIFGALDPAERAVFLTLPARSA